MAMLSKIYQSGLIACFFTLSLSAQDKLFIKGKSPAQYVVYKTNGKETLQSISNGFGLSVTKLSSFNKININATKAFAKGTEVKIPVTKDNLLQRHADNSEPVVHVVGKGDNLFRVSQLYYKVPLASLRSWNGLKKDVVKNGQQVIVGYMVNAKQAAVTEKKNEVKKEEAAVNLSAPEIKAEPKKEGAAVSNTTASTPPPAEKTNADKKDAAVQVAAPLVLSSVATKEKVAEKKISTDANAAYVPKEGDEGFFASEYLDHPKEQAQQFRSGDAATFKTISGWTDRKFYVLMNEVAPKTIVRITGTAGKSICAMVLGPLQETKGANGLLLRLSNSAASALGLAGEKFTVTVTYFE